MLQQTASDDEDGPAPSPSRPCPASAHLGLYNTQAAYNKSVITALSEQYRDISQHSRQPELLQLLYPAAADLTPLLTSAILCSCCVRLCQLCAEANLQPLVGSGESVPQRERPSAACSSTAPPATVAASDSQKKRFRTFVRLQLGQRKMDAKTVDEEVRKRGVTQCIGRRLPLPRPAAQHAAGLPALPAAHVAGQRRRVPQPAGQELGTLELVLLEAAGA